MELEAAIFDFGGVLTTSVVGSFMEYERTLGLPKGTLLPSFLAAASEGGAEPSYALLEKGLLSEGDFYAHMFSHVRANAQIDVAIPDDPVAIREGMFSSLRRNEEMIAVAAAIGQHYRTAILSNNVKEWTGWREMVDAHIFDLVIDSSEVGMRKPDPEIYHLTCEKLGVEPAKAAFVDDILNNVEAARAVGLDAIHFTTTEDVLDALRPRFPKAFQEHRRDA